MADTQHKELMDALSSLYQTGKYSDLAIVCDEKTYRVHKAIVCPRSLLFAKACDGPFQEAQTGIINLEDDDPEAVRLMMHYFYHLDYPYVEMPGAAAGNSEASSLGTGQDGDVSGASQPNLSGRPRPDAYVGNRPSKRIKLRGLDETPPDREPNFVLHTKVYALADKYLIDGLKAVALEKFREDAKTSWSTEQFLQAAEVAYTSTQDREVGMKHFIVSIICRHKHWLLERDSVKQCLRNTPDLAYDVLMHPHQNS